MDLQDLKKPLGMSDIDFKPKQCNYYGGTVYCTVLAYKDARVDMNRLDTVVGQGGWQNLYKRDDKGVLQCGIGILVDSAIGWVWKWSNGTPSDFEGEKGEYSDAFKRAGFMWGIGRDLYDFPSVKIVLNEREFTDNNGKYKANPFFKPNAWDWKLEYKEGSGIIHRLQGRHKGIVRFDSNPNNAKNPQK